MSRSLEVSSPAAASDGELRELTWRAFDELSGAVRGIGRIHRAVATRAFGASGPGAAPARVVHDTVSKGVYAGISGAGRAAGRGACALVGPHTISDSPRGAFLLGVLNGLYGDQLAEEDSDLAFSMTAHVARRPATPRVVVFLHGLMETESGWRLGGGETYGDRLAADLDFTPVYVRYNTGRHISENGRELAELLEQLVHDWPVEVERLALVGHSMGGLVARSACHYGVEHGCRWTGRVKHVVSLGTPHFGAPVAEGVAWLAAGLRKLPETAPFGDFFARRSAGIRDLRNGSLVDEDWHGRDPHALKLAACQEIPLLEGATHCFISASLVRSRSNPLGRFIGDALVLEASASGRSKTRRIGFDASFGHHVAGASHISLLNHPEVYEKLREWLMLDTSTA
jgi:pimeloyl-ACP methyl ester carboxylesterase